MAIEQDAEWTPLPEEIRARIESGATLIGDLRNAIGAAAKVQTMPAVTVIGEVWSPDGSLIIHGMAGAWPCATSVGGFCLRVLIGAGPAICTEPDLVRAVLAHEFAHCFEIGRRIVDNVDLGTPLGELRGSSLDPEREAAMLGHPADWLGSDDARLVQWNDERFQSITDEVIRLVETGTLPGAQPPTYLPASFNVPDEWKQHARRLRG